MLIVFDWIVHFLFLRFDTVILASIGPVPILSIGSAPSLSTGKEKVEFPPEYEASSPVIGAQGKRGRDLRRVN